MTTVDTNYILCIKKTMTQSFSYLKWLTSFETFVLYFILDRISSLLADEHYYYFHNYFCYNKYIFGKCYQLHPNE